LNHRLAHTAQTLQRSTHLNQANVALLEGVLELCVVQLFNGIQHVILRLKLSHAHSLAAVTVHICEGGLDVLAEVILRVESTAKKPSALLQSVLPQRQKQPGNSHMFAQYCLAQVGVLNGCAQQDGMPMLTVCC
jgi:hypothetical protein